MLYNQQSTKINIEFKNLLLILIRVVNKFFVNILQYHIIIHD